MNDMGPIGKCLADAGGLIREGWCQGAFAANARGEAVGVEDDDACRFCALGAIDRVAYSSNESRLASDCLERVIGCEAAGWNDHEERTKEEVLAAFDAAARRFADY